MSRSHNRQRQTEASSTEKTCFSVSGSKAHAAIRTPHHARVRILWHPEVAVLREPVSGIISLISGKNTGKFAESGAGQRYQRKMWRNSAFCSSIPYARNREIGADNRESLDRYQGKAPKWQTHAGGSDTPIQHSPRPSRSPAYLIADVPGDGHAATKIRALLTKSSATRNSGRHADDCRSGHRSIAASRTIRDPVDHES